MPRLSMSKLEEIEDHRREIAGILAQELREVLWVGEKHPHSWYARHSPDRRWETGRTATTIRDNLVSDAADRLLQKEPYRRWREVHELHGGGRYRCFQRMRRIWADWDTPEGIEES